MATLAFILGMMVGLLVMLDQRRRDRTRFRALLSNLRSEEDQLSPSFSLESKLSLAISYQQQHIQDQQEKLETLQSILNAAPVGYLHVDDENRLVWANPQAERLLNIPSQTQAAPRLLLELVRSYDLDELIDQTRRANAPQQAEWLFHPVSSDLFAPAQPQPQALRGYGLPLSDRHVGVFLENRQEAFVLKQQRDRWISDVAHELKTPLTSIRLVGETLQNRLSPPLSTWAERLINETMRLSQLVQDLLDLSHIEQRSPRPLKPESVDIIPLIQSAWLSLEPLTRKKKLQLAYQGPDHLSLPVDEARMYRVFINLLDNSIKYSPETGVIRVDVAPPTVMLEMPSPVVVIDIVDAGPGFPDDAIAHVFERFYRADPSRARPGHLTRLSSESDRPSPCSGSGLGLAIVHQIVEAHGGQITAQNHPDTQGAWLHIVLPIGEAPVPPAIIP